MSRKTNANDYLFGRRETGIMQTKYIQRGAAAFRTLSPNTSSSSDSCDDSFDQIYKSFKKPVVPTTDSDTTTMQEDVNSMEQSSSDRNKFGHEECDELDELFKNIDLKDTTTDNVPREWLEQNEHPVTTDNVGLSTVYEGSESNYRSTKSVNSSTISKDSANFELSVDSLINCIKPSENSTDSLDRSYVTSHNVLPIELNDTLEDVEYVCDERNRYLLKPVSKAANTNRTNEPEYVSADSSVILIDSSPDTSFVTASNEPKLIDVKDIKTETLSVKSSLSYCTLTSMNTNRFNSSACTVSSTHLSFTTAKTNFKLIDSDDIKSECSDDKTSTASEAKTNSWSTLDSSANVSTAPMIDDNDSLFVGKTKLESTECGDDARSETSGDGQMFTCITYPKTASFFEDDEEKTVDSDAAKSSEYFTAAATNDSTASTNHLSVSAARYNTLDDVPSFSTDSTVSSVCHSNIPQNYSTDSGKHFNDSLDRIEYMMRKGRELQQKTCDRASPVRVTNSPAAQYKMPTPKALTTSSQKRTVTGPKTPVIKAKPFVNSAKKPTQPSPHAVTPSTRILKPFNRPQSAKSQPAERKLTPSRASPIVSPAFKKPTFPTSGTKKESAQSRIPTAKNFNHIVSPIGAYIKNIAAPPLLANVKPTSDFFDSSYCNKMSKESLDQSVMSEAGGAGKPVKLVSSLPVKFFTSSQQQRVIDEKFQKIPGGEKLNRIIGQMPSVISHQGRIHSGNPVKRIVPTDDSFADVSVMSGDISVQVVRDVKRQ